MDPAAAATMCAVCSEPGKYHCQKCCKVNYCSKEHQIVDWKKHRGDCFPFEVVNGIVDRQETRCMIATRDIGQGEKLLKEKAFLVGPKSRNPNEHICLGCTANISFTERMIVPCSNCDWNLCSRDCAENTPHAEYECELFKSKGITPSENLPVDTIQMYDTVTVLRILMLKKKDEAKFNIIVTKILNEQIKRVCEASRYSTEGPKKFITEECGITEFDDETLEHIFWVVRSNSISMCEVSPGQISRKYFVDSRYNNAFFTNTQIYAPSCVSNVRWALTDTANGGLSITTGASVNIQKGEMLSGEFTHYMTGTQIRRKVLLDQFMQNCLCKRCQDPTELGSYTSAIKCRRPACHGFYLHDDPLTPGSDFRCDKCSDIITAQDVTENMYTVTVALDKVCNIQNSDEEAGIVQIEYQVRNVSKYLHPNHFILIKTLYSICSRFTNIVADKGSRNINCALAGRISEYAMKCLEMADLFHPGLSRLRGRLLYILQLSLGISALAGKRLSQNLPESSKRYKRKKFEQLISIQEECHRILEFEPEGTEESIMYATLNYQIIESKRVLDVLK